MSRAVFLLGTAVMAAFLALQLVPYGRAHTNLPVTGEPAWDSPQTRAFAVRACFDCHSNETVWPWYSHIAPASWLIQRDVDQGRRKLNYSEWGRQQGEAEESSEVFQKGTMPPPYYSILHPDSILSAEERAQFTAGLIRTLGGEGEEDERESRTSGRGEDDDKEDD